MTTFEEDARRSVPVQVAEDKVASMSSPTRALQASAGLALELGSIVLSAEFAVVTRSKQLVRRRRLDTFDRRLQESGLTLDHQIVASGERLVLGHTDGSPTVAVPVKDVRWPALADVLPPGLVGDVVAPVIGIRALMVVSDERRRRQQLELRNEDGKTVARVELDESVSAGGESARLVVQPMRGYDDEARQAEDLLVGIGLRPVEDGEDGEKGRAGSADKGPEGLRDEPAGLLLATALSDFLLTMRENLPGLLDDVDTEFLHDFRVAVRRTRSTLKLGRPALPEVMRERWEPDFKWLGDMTTPVRDLDVYELGLPAMSRWLVKADPADLDPLATHLRRRRTAAYQALVGTLRSARFQRLVTDWEEELARLRDTPDLPQDSDREHLSGVELAELSISRAHRRVARGGAAIEADSPAEDLHALRKRCKELRYALEAFAPVVDKRARRRVVNDLKEVQDSLGRFQDSEVQRRALRELAEEMMAAGTTAGALLAMGELIGHLDVEQDRARVEFHETFARLERPTSLQVMERLGVRR
jgi:CHAD domain-containing protein